MINNYTEESLVFREIDKHIYEGNNCIFSCGFVEGHPYDTCYLRWEKDGVEPFSLLLRPDEVAIISWLCSNIFYSIHIESDSNES